MSIRASYVSQLTVVETLTGAFISSQDNTVTINGLNTSVELDGTTTPAVTKGTAAAKAMSTGSGTIDLTSLPGLTGDETISLTGLKVEFWKFQNPSTNSGSITIVPGASNGYDIFGASSKIVLAPGQEAMGRGYGAAQTVGSSHKTIDITGTGSEQLYYEITAG